MADTMDFALPSAEAGLTSNVPPKFRTVELPGDSPCDAAWLDHYASLYSGRRKINRLLFIARACPQLALQAYTIAIKEVQEQTFDTQLYEQITSEYNKRAESSGQPRQIDEAWLERTRRYVADQSDKLQVELKNYQTNLIKESIRMAHRDIAAFEHKCGELQTSLRTYLKSRDFATSTNQVLEVCLTIIDVALDAQNYAFIRNYVIKAEAAYDSIFASASNAGGSSGPKSVHLPGVTGGSSTLAQQRAIEAEEKRKSLLADRIAVASGIAELGSGNYARAARKFLGLGMLSREGDAVHQYIPPGDIALYGVLSALASFDRTTLKRQVIDNANLRPLLELEPHLKAIVSAFHANNYKAALQTLARYEPLHLLDIHLSPHIDALVEQIKARAVIQFFAPFSTVTLSRMAAAFGWSEAEMQAEVVRLISKKELKARVDSRNKTVHAYAPSRRVALFKHAMETGKQQEMAARALLLRMNLIANDVLVKAPKHSSKESNDAPESPGKGNSRPLQPQQQNGIVTTEE